MGTSDGIGGAGAGHGGRPGGRVGSGGGLCTTAQPPSEDKQTLNSSPTRCTLLDAPSHPLRTAQPASLDSAVVTSLDRALVATSFSSKQPGGASHTARSALAPASRLKLWYAAPACVIFSCIAPCQPSPKSSSSRMVRLQIEGTNGARAGDGLLGGDDGVGSDGGADGVGGGGELSGQAGAPKAASTKRAPLRW